VTNTHGTIKIDLQEVLTRNATARDIISGFSVARPAQADVWQYIGTALADTVMLAAAISILRADLADVRLARANLAAAARAAIGADLDGDYDPLGYLRDELAAQGYGADWGRA
jgi:hypothetical protein